MAEEAYSGKGRHLYDDVVEKIKEMIRRGEFKAGDRLPSERLLSERFEVSRNCLRQAIQALSERKILESRRGDGTYVCSVDEPALIESFSLAIQAQRDLIREILEFRLLMEPQIASLAAKNITRDELDRLKIIVCDQERRILAGTEDCELDAAFHTELARACGNRIVSRVMNTANGILNESRAGYLWTESRRKASVVGHLKIIDALESRSPDMAFEAMREHLWSIEQIILGSGEKEGP